MRSLLRLVSAMSKVERMVLGTLTVMLLLSLLMMLRLFYVQNTVDTPVAGGTYIEGSVGEILPLNPWFTSGNDVNRDIVSLVFSGLMKYETGSGKIVNDLATVTVSDDNRIYTAKLKPGLLWHDSTAAKPHPVTAEDVVYTFQTMQNPEFGNPILKQNFRGIEVEKLNEQTVRFRLSKPYSFFTSNLTIGIVPKNAFEGVPVKKLDQTLDFGFHPIGAGPYSFVSLLQTDFSTEVTLKRFEQPEMPHYNIDRFVFRVFPEYTALLADITNLNGVRLVPRNEKGQPVLPRHFHVIPYTLPQYVGLFFNLDHPIVSDAGVRLGLQLAIDKQKVVQAINETRIVDTPLLEIDTGDWHYKFDATAAQGAFFASNWNIPEKVRLQRLLEQRNSNAVGPLSSTPRVALLGSGAQLTITGSTKNLSLPAYINGIRVQTGTVLSDGTFHAFSGSWMVKLPSGNGQSGSLKLGMNMLKLTNAKDDIIDSAYLERFSNAKIFGQASVEQQIVHQFLLSKELPPTDPAAISVNDMYLENGYLRRKQEKDALHTRVNDQGKKLSLTILTSTKPPSYQTVATVIQQAWNAVGADVKLDIPATAKEFEQKLLARNYDVVLFGQTLSDNLDSYPYWHSSQIQDRSGDSKNMKLDAFNLSQYASFEADALLTRIRETGDGKSRASALTALNEQFKKDVPGIVLYSPLYIFAHDDTVKGVDLGKLSLHADRFRNSSSWYVSTERRFIPNRNWLSFFSWFFGFLKSNES